MSLAPRLRPLELQRPDAAPGRSRLVFLAAIITIGDGMALPHHRGVDIGLALPAACEAAAVAIDPADVAGDETAPDQRQQGTAGGTAAIHIPARAVATALAEFRGIDAFEPELFAIQPQRIAIDRLGGSGKHAGGAKLVLQDSAGNRQQAEQ